jgi:uncharacterized protein YgbK (DUF1537 family)
MKTSILITGSGTMSKSTLRRECQSFDCEVVDMNFGNTEIRFQTKKEAVKALSDAFQELSSDKEDWKASTGSYRRGSSLSYDAGNARIVTT